MRMFQPSSVIPCMMFVCCSLIPLQLAGVPDVCVFDQHGGWTLWSFVWSGYIHHQMGGYCQGTAWWDFLTFGVTCMVGMV